MNLARCLSRPSSLFRIGATIAPHRTPFALSRTQRSYALSRFSEKNTGTSRRVSRPPQRRPTLNSEAREDTATRASQTFDDPASTLVADDDGLRKLLFHGNTLVVERQLEMLNVLAGFEQSNKYTISGEDGKPLGYIAEDSKGFLGTIARQVLRTHRPFRAVIMDNEGKPLLFIRRPFSWINSRMFVQRLKDKAELLPGTEPRLETFGEVQQEWHMWRRRYDLFLRELVVPEPAQDPSQVLKAEPMFYQIARVDAPFLAWTFAMQGANGHEIASMVRAFRGFGYELFTDTGRYSVNFAPRELIDDTPLQGAPATAQATTIRELGLDERALFLALAVNIDFDYFWGQAIQAKIACCLVVFAPLPNPSKPWHSDYSLPTTSFGGSVARESIH